MIHIEGKLYDGGDGVELQDSCGSLAEKIASELWTNHTECKKSRFDVEDDNDQIEASLFIPRISFRAYFSDNQCSLEDAESNQILLSVGALDIFQEWYGYSEWTIMGYDVENFKLVSEDGSEHDLEKIFKSYIGKYVHIVIDILEEID